MGFFSWDCKACGHPALCKQAADPEINSWMTKAIVMFSNGDSSRGNFDGYGRVGRFDGGTFGDVPCLYHLACWEAAGCPPYSGPSRTSKDQGWFFDDGDHDMLEPGTVPTEEQAAHLEVAQAMRDGRKRGVQFRHKDEDADEGTYSEIFRLVCEEAKTLTPNDRLSRWGYDPLEYAL